MFSFISFLYFLPLYLICNNRIRDKFEQICRQNVKQSTTYFVIIKDFQAIIQHNTINRMQYSLIYGFKTATNNSFHNQRVIFYHEKSIWN